MTCTSEWSPGCMDRDREGTGGRRPCPHSALGLSSAVPRRIQLSPGRPSSWSVSHRSTGLFSGIANRETRWTRNIFFVEDHPWHDVAYPHSATGLGIQRHLKVAP